MICSRNDESKANKAIFISGPDGVGKTTQAQRLIELLRKRGMDPVYVWLRFYHILTLPVLALFRVMNLYSVSRTSDGRIQRQLDLRNRRTLQTVYESAMLVDMTLASFFRISIPMAMGRTIICDRHAVDTVVDIMIATHDNDFYRRPIGQMLLKLGPPNRVCFVMICETNELEARRADVALDQHGETKTRLYKLLADTEGLALVDVGGKSPSEVTSTLVSMLGKGERNEDI